VQAEGAEAGERDPQPPGAIVEDPGVVAQGRLDHPLTGAGEGEAGGDQPLRVTPVAVAEGRARRRSDQRSRKCESGPAAKRGCGVGEQAGG
jgi:hypothetical protein